MPPESRRTKDATPAVTESSCPSPDVPWQIWIAVIFLGLEGIGNLLSIPAQPAAATWLAAKILFITGLILGWRLVFIWFLAEGSLHVLAFSMQAPFIAFLNLVLVLLVVSARRHFFPGRGRGSPTAGAKKQTSGTFAPEFKEVNRCDLDDYFR